jgi:hypothetical protein
MGITLHNRLLRLHRAELFGESREDLAEADVQREDGRVEEMTVSSYHLAKVRFALGESDRPSHNAKPSRSRLHRRYQHSSRSLLVGRGRSSMISSSSRLANAAVVAWARLIE